MGIFSLPLAFCSVAFFQSAASSPADKKGLVKVGDSWVSKEDAPYVKQGLIKHGKEWITKEDKKKLDSGWRRQDLEWISPEEAVNVDKGLFKIDGAWITEAEANGRHANPAKPWAIPSEHFIIRSTVPRAEILRLAGTAEAAFATLRKLLGTPTVPKLSLILFGTIEEANAYAAQHAADHSSVFPGYIPEGDPDRPGVALYDGPPGKGFSELYIAHAAAHKFLDAAIPDAHKLPDWFVEGMATYADRFADAKLRSWAVDRIIQRGGLSKIGELVSRFALTADDREGSQKKLFEVGLLLAYFAEAPEKGDGERFKKALHALENPAGRESAIEKLVAQPDELEKRVKKFGGLDR